MSKKTAGCLVFLLLTIVAKAQTVTPVRYDNFSFVTNQVQAVGIFTTVLSPSPQAQVTVCAHPANGVPCTNTVQTYTDITGNTKCPLTTQLTPYNGNVCMGTADAKGNFGFWIPPGTYDYTVCPQGQFTCLGPYPISVSPTTGGGTPPPPQPLPGVSTFTGVSDAVFDNSCSVISGSNVLTCIDSPFTNCPTGATVSVTGGAKDSGNNVISLITTISSCNSPSIALLAVNASNTIGSQGTRWGTDNLVALKAQYASSGKKTFVIPPGNYLVNTPNASPLTLTSGTEIIFQKGATIYWVGPVGSPNNAEGGVVFLNIPDATSNVHIRIDGTINGDNITGGPGVPFLNQSQLVSIFNGFTGLIDNITIDGTGLIQYLYGFDVHSLATGIVNFDGLRINVSAKGTNIGSPGWQTHLTLKKSFGIETSTSGAVIAYNVFDASGGISLGGASGSCNGDVVSNNTFLNTTAATNLFLADCVYGATVTGNTFYVKNANNYGISLNAGTFSSTGGNVISGNTIMCGGAFPNQATAAINIGVSVTPGNLFVDNNVLSDPAVPNSYCNFGVLDASTSGATDTFVGGYYTMSGHGFEDFAVQGSGVSYVLADGVQLGTGSLSTTTSFAIDPRSSFIFPTTRTGYFGPIDAAGVPNAINTGKLGYSTVGASTQSPVNTFWIAATSIPVAAATVVDCKVGLGTAAGNVACALYDSDGTGGSPGTVLCQNGTGVAAVASSVNTIPISGCPTLTARHTYYTVIGFSSATTSVDYDTVTNSYFVGSVSCCTTFTSQTFSQTGRTYTIYLDVNYGTNSFSWGPTYNASNPIPSTYIPWATPGTIGSTTPSSASFSTLTGSVNSVINVKAPPYNAKGDGSTDDTTAIQAALTAAASSASNVFFPKGTYEVSSAINIPAGMTGAEIEGVGVNSIIQASGSWTATSLITADSTLSRLRITNMQFDANNKTSITSVVNLTRSPESSIQNHIRGVYIANIPAGATGLILDGCEDTTVENTVILGFNATADLTDAAIHWSVPSGNLHIYGLVSFIPMYLQYQNADITGSTTGAIAATGTAWDLTLNGVYLYAWSGTTKANFFTVGGSTAFNNVSIHGSYINNSNLANAVAFQGKYGGTVVIDGTTFDQGSGSNYNLFSSATTPNTGVTTMFLINGPVWLSGASTGTPAAGVYYNLVGNRPTTSTGVPSCVASAFGTHWLVTDSSVTTWGSTYVGGGSTQESIFCNGTNWTVEAK